MRESFQKLRVHHARSRRGTAAVLAMLFLVLFSVLAVGFYSATTVSVQIARNDRDATVAQLSAESGWQFIRYHLAQVTITPGSDDNAVFTNLFNQIDARIHGSSNLGGNEINWSTDTAGNKFIYIPGASGGNATWMSLGAAGASRLTVTLQGTDIVVKSVGKSTTNPVQRAVQIRYRPATAAWTLGAAGLLTRGSVSLSNGAQISGGSVFSGVASGTVPLNMSGGARIDNNFSYSTNTLAPVISNGARVLGQIIPGATASFPVVDTSMFAQFVPAATASAGPKVITATSSLSSTAVLTNIRIKANANTSFGNSQQLNGVIYIESPNRITFGGGMRISGIIVTDNNAATPQSGNSITVANGVRIDTLATLVASSFPASERIAELRALSGAVILAPNYLVTLAGGARTYDGAMVGGQFDISNGYRGSIAGGLIALSSNPFTMMGGGQVTFTGGNTAVPGLTGAGRYQLDPITYLEVDP